jgi:hypothetical protein
MISNNAKHDFSVLDQRPMGGSLMLFSEKNTDKVLRAHPQYFPLYDRAPSVSAYLLDLGREPITQTSEHLDIQRGLLHGFPLRASEQYAKHKDAMINVADLYETIPPHSTEKRLLHEYLGVNDLATHNYDQINMFRENHHIEMRQFLDTHLRYMPEDKNNMLFNSGICMLQVYSMHQITLPLWKIKISYKNLNLPLKPQG